MLRLSITRAMAILLCGASIPAPAYAAPAPRQIVLLGARWCAPCMAELRDLPALAAAAAPDRLVLAWMDRPLPIPPALADRVSIMPPAQARALAVRIGGEGYGLPMATVIGAGIDGGDQPCPPWRAPLAAHDIAKLRGACAGSPTSRFSGKGRHDPDPD